MLLTCVKLSLTVWPFYALKTDILLLPILKQIPMPTTQESVVRSSSNVKVKGGTRKKVIAKCLILTRDKALKELTTSWGLPTSQTYGFISDDSPQWIVRWSSLPKFDLALSECGKNTTIFRGPVDLRFESNTSPLRHDNSEIFLTQWALGSRIRLQKRLNKYICASGKAKGKEPFHSRFHLFPYTGGIGIFVETRGYDKSFFNDIYTVVSNTDVYLSVLRRVIGTASKQARLTWTWQHEVEGLWYMPLSQDCSLGLVPLTESNTP